MTWLTLVVLVLIGLALCLALFVLLWSRVSKELRAMDHGEPRTPPAQVPKLTVLQRKRRAGWK